MDGIIVPIDTLRKAHAVMRVLGWGRAIEFDTGEDINRSIECAAAQEIYEEFSAILEGKAQ